MGHPLHTIVIIRGGAPPSVKARLGHRLYPPPARLSDLAMPANGDVVEALGWERIDHPGTRFGLVDATALVCPTPWERLYVSWIAEQTGASVRWAAPATIGAIGQTLRGEGWASPDELPEHVNVRSAATRRGEARAAIRDIREFATSAEDCDNVLILIPGSRALRALWLRELADADVPVRAAHYVSIDTHAISHWVLAIAELSRWDTHPVSRFQLRAVLEGKYWRQEALERGTRKSVRELLASMRREAFTLAEWKRHLASPRVSRWDREKALRWTNTIWQGAKVGPEPFRRLQKLIVDLGIRPAVAARGDAMASDVCEKVLKTLGSLAYIETKKSKGHPMVEQLGTRQLLKGALEARYTNQSTSPDHGVRLSTYGQYDGATCDLLIAAGLGEGDFPNIPARLDAQQMAWARALGLLKPNETGQDLVMAEIELQLDLFSHAMSKAQAVVLSYASEGAGTEHRHPGPLLSLLVGRWPAQAWHNHPQVEVFNWSHEVPRSPSEATSWQDAALFAGDPKFVAWLKGLDALDAASQARVDEIVAGFEALRATRIAASERSPRVGKTSSFGAYSGLLGADIKEPEAYSASALENYGQCGTKYFLSNILNVRDREDQPDRLDPREVGTLLHRAFSDAARRAIDIANDELWALCWRPDETCEDVVDRVSFAVAQQLEDVVKEYLVNEASLSGALTQAVVARWYPAIKRWMRSHAQPWLPKNPAEQDYAADKKVQAAQAAFDRTNQALASVEILRDKIADGTIKTQKAAAKAAPTYRGVLNQADLELAFKHRESGGVDALKAKVEAKAQLAAQKLKSARHVVERRFAQHLNREVAHSELGFGLDPSRTERDADPYSVPDPVEVTIGDTIIKVRGQIDRVDWDRERHTLAVRDLKSGRGRTRQQLERQILSGEHLQLPLYAIALEELTKLDGFAHLRGATVAEVSLEFPRDPEKNTSELRLANSACTLDDQAMSWRTLSEAWLRSHVDNIRHGQFPLAPTNCPLERSGYCDYARACGYTQALGRRGIDPRVRPQPHVEPRALKKKRVANLDVIQPQPRQKAELDREILRAHHEAATLAAANTALDVSISAGAGTGKTYNLVLRYLAALAEGTDPSQILCITFTRRAAGEMKRRVRDALLRETQGPQMQFVNALRQDKPRFRRILLELSTAPITTIDALAGEVFRESHAALAAAKGQPPRQFEVCTDEDVNEELQTFVSNQFLREFEEGEPHLMALTQELDPIRLRELLAETCRYGVPSVMIERASLDQRTELIANTWITAMRQAGRAIATVVKGWDIDPLKTALDVAKSSPTRPIHPDALAKAEAALFAISGLQTSRDPTNVAGWRNIAAIFALPENKTLGGETWLGDTEFRTLWIDRQAELKVCFVTDPDRQKAVKGFCSVIDGLDALAEFAARSTFVAERWSLAFRAYLLEHGKLRFSDVEALASEYIHDDRVLVHLAQRFSMRHIFVDEAQDTSHRQLAFLRGLQALVESKGQPVNAFYVGDLKQSIYAFRGAEVDVFMRRIDRALSDPNHVSEKFTINRRSTPSLLHAINTLFSVLFPAAGDSVSLDPRSEVPFEGLVAPSDTPDQSGAIELFLAPGRGFDQDPAPELDDTDDIENDIENEVDDDHDEPPDDSIETTALQRGLVARMLELVIEYPPTAEGPQIAILVGSWARAEYLRDLLGAYGVSVAVQGGRGLLTTPEVDSVVQWLESVTHPNLHTPFVGALRGPGIAVSDAGLYCLKRGHGLTQERTPLKPKSVKQAATFGTLNAHEAAHAWVGSDHPNFAKITAQLTLDAEALERFKKTMNELFPRVGVDSTADTLAWLVTKLNLWSFWGASENGRQRIANLRRFLDLVRDLEETLGNDPQHLVRRLAAMRDGSDPSAGGLEAGSGAQALITTYWQSKGLEWPVVVLPELEATRIRGQRRGLSISRIYLPDHFGDVVYSPEVRQSDPARPLGSDPTGITPVLDQYRAPASRAELRRLLYVAMTRAKYKLVMTATVHGPSSAKSETTLASAKDWSTTLRVALDLKFSEDGTPTMGPQAVWAPLVDAGAVTLIDGVAAGGLLDATQQPWINPDLTLPSPEIFDRWTIFAPRRRTLFRPSDDHNDTVPPWDEDLSTPLPAVSIKRETEFENSADAGTAFHALMEATAFMWTADPSDVAVDQLIKLELDQPFEKQWDRVDEMIRLYDSVLASPMTRELRAAALAGRLFHEVPVAFPIDDHWVNGVVDLMWIDRDGIIHLLDYKSGFRHPTQADPITPELKKHYAQVSLYAKGVESAGVNLGSYGIWYVACGAILRWTP